MSVLLTFFTIFLFTLIIVNILGYKYLADPSDDNEAFFLFFNLFFGLTISGIIAFVPTLLLSQEICYSTGTIVNVGGCDKAGNCGVTTSTGDFRNIRYPTIGQSTNRCSREWK